MKCNYLVFLLVIFTLSGKLTQAQVNADFSVNKSYGCTPLTDVQFTDLSTPSDGSLTYSWDLGNGNTSTLQNPGATYTNPGTPLTKYYTVKLTVSKGGQTSSKTMVITVFNNPVVNFTTDNTPKACVPFTAQFHNLSSSDTTMKSWQWQYGNGDYNELNQQNYTYNREGKYNVTLTVTDDHNCSSTITKNNYIDVASPPDAQFYADPAFSCSAPATIKFINDSRVTGSPAYQWIMGSSASSQKDASFTIAKYDTTYTIKLSVKDLDYNTDGSCVSSNELQYRIDRIKAIGTVTQGSKVINSTGSIVCAGTVNMESHSLPEDGTVYWIIDNDVSSTYHPITSYKFEQAGNHTITLIANPNNYCADTLKWSFYVDKVIPEFTQTPAKTCKQSASITFTNTSSVNAASFVWEFGNGTTSTSKDPAPVTYSVPGDVSPYDVHDAVYFSSRLIATTINNCSDTVTHTFVINRPTALFSVDTVSGCAPLLVNFTDHSISDTAIAKRDWNMGDGTVLHYTTEGTASYKFTDPGIYNTSLVITNKSGCDDASYTIPIRVGVQPNASFSISPSAVSVCQSDVITITDNTPAADKPDSWLYTVNGISISACTNDKSPKFKYKPDIGPLVITQKVGYNGCYKESTQTITNKGPIASFIDSVTNCSDPYTYGFIGSYKGTNVATFKWEVEGATISNSQSISYTFPNPPLDKNYTVKFIVFDNGCSDTAVQTVRVRQKIANFTAPAWACALKPVTFTASASQPLSDFCGEKYTWDFDDATSIIRTNQDPTDHIFENSGNYKVKFSALHDNGCVDTISHRIRIYRPKAVLITDKTGGCLGTQIKFTDASVPDENSIIKLYMDFGDLTHKTGYTPDTSFIRIYMDQGLYSPYLKVTDDKGCYDSTLVTIGIVDPDVRLFSSEVPPQTCVNKTITFTESMKELDYMFWDFGDGATSNANQLSIDHVYTTEGQFNVKIKVSKYGCKDSTTLLVETQKADASFVVNDSLVTCPKLPFSMRHLYPSTNIVSGEWDTGDKIFPYDTAKHTIIYNYKTSGTYTAQLSIRTSFGCTDFKTKTIKVLGPKAKLNLSTRTTCRKVPVTFTMTDTLNIGKFEWDFGDGIVDRTGTQLTTSHKYLVGDTMYVFLNLDPNGTCPIALPDTIVVDSLAASFTVKDTAGCDKEPVIFKNTSIGSNVQTWYFSDGSSDEFSPEHTFAPGTYPITLVVSSANSCSDTARRTMTITTTPTLALSIASCVNKQAQLHAATGTGNYINWWPPEGLSAVNSYDPIATPDSSIYYKARVTNIEGGCTKTDSILIIRPRATIWPIDTMLYVGESIQIDVSDTSHIKSYRWEPETNLSCTACLNPIARPTESTQYFLILEEPSGCFTDSLRVSIFLKFGDPNFVAPTAFKPGDVNNGVFRLRSQAYMELLEFKILNRWGNPVFTSTEGMQADEGGGYSSVKGWDGRYQGKDQPIDTYIWVATGRVFSKEGSTVVKKKGTVILLR